MTDYSTMTMAELISARAQNNDDIREANRVAKAFKDEQDLIDAAIIVRMEADGIKRFASDDGSVSVSITEEPNVDDWEALYEHIYNNKDWALLHRRVSATAFREMLKQGTPPPGTSSRTVKSVNFRS